jgi:hypothetical protein
MSMKGDTCSALGTLSPVGSNRKVTFSPQGVLVTCMRQQAGDVARPPALRAFHGDVTRAAVPFAATTKRAGVVTLVGGE